MFWKHERWRARKQIRTELKLSFRRGSPHRKHTSCLSCWSPQHISLHFLLPSHLTVTKQQEVAFECHARAVTTVLILLFDWLIYCMHEPPSVPPSLLSFPFPGSFLLLSAWHETSLTAAATAQTFHQCASLIKSVQATEKEREQDWNMLNQLVETTSATVTQARRQKLPGQGTPKSC